jgi:5-methylcytosine-specific restriction protein A
MANTYSEIFEAEILRRIHNMNGLWIDIISGDVHKACGGYPGPNHRMPICCSTMRRLMSGNDEILPGGPAKGNGATLTIRYYRINHPKV